MAVVFGPLLAAAAPPSSDSAAESSTSPDQRELWVPTQQLKDILAKYPNAVVISREQYETLVRDAGVVHKPALEAPRRVILTSANYQAHLKGKVVQVTAALSVNVLSNEWAQLPLNFAGVSIGSINVDGEAAMLATMAGAAPANTKPQAKVAASAFKQAALLLRGKGDRVVTIEFTIPISSEAALSQFQIELPSAAASVFSLELPPDQRVESDQPILIKKTTEATLVTATLAPKTPLLALNWRGVGGSDQSLQPIVAAEGTYSIDQESVRGEFDFDIQTPLGKLPASYSVTLPANAKVLQVTGEELAKWEMSGGKLQISFQEGERTATKLHLAVEIPSLAGGASTALALPVPKFEGVARFQGSFSIRGDDGVIVKDVITDATLEPAPFVGKPLPHQVASYQFTAPPTSPRVTVEKVRARFSADLDSLVEFKQEAVFIQRTLTLHPEKGEIFDVSLSIPNGEEVLSVRYPGGAEPDWRLQDRKLGLRWTSNPGAGVERVFEIRTRIEPPKWSQIGADGLTFALEDTKIDGAERVTGYIALKSDDAFRLEAEPSDTLERRDGRTTPVKGDYAWFRGADFALRVKVAKRPGEVLAALTGYALPLEGVLDLHAQIDYTFLHSGARSVRVRVPKEIAANFHFDGPQIAERNLSEDVWTIVFQKELTGDYPMKITGQVAIEKGQGRPAEGSDTLSEKESRFQIAVPVIAPLDVVRTSGVWAVEANTETEITFAAKGMNELDSLLAPKLAGYEPRHRVIGVFNWLGADYDLTLSGVRHAAASVLTSVVDRLNLDTVVSASGTERDQATFQLRTAGAQYLDVELPEKSRLLSLTVNDDLVKPVGDRPDQVRVELPGTNSSAEALTVCILYETPKAAWKGSGGYAVRAPKVAQDIPILRSQWRLFLPDGFEYTGVAGNLMAPPMAPERPLLAEILDGSKVRLKRLVKHEPPDFSAAAINEAVALPTPDVTSQTYTPGVGPVNLLLIEAQGFYDSGRLDLANKRCDQILAIDKYNIPARKLQEKIDRAEKDFGVAAYNETRAEAMRRLDLAWAKPVRRNRAEDSAEGLANRTNRIENKLNRIIIPKLDFREASIREAIDFLKKKSVDMDSDSPPGEKGINIVLKLDAGGASAPAQEPGVPAAPSIPGLEPIPGAPSPVVLPPALDPSDARITVALTNMPLMEALRYVTNLSGLKLKIEPYAVYIVPASVNTDVLITKEYVIHPDLIPRVAGDAAASLSAPVPGGAADTTKGGSGIAEKESTKNWLISNGVQFNSGGASAVYLPGSGRLIVRNTQEQIDLMDQIVHSNQGPSEPQDFSKHGRRGAAANHPGAVAATSLGTVTTPPTREQLMRRKLEQIIIPKLDFKEASLRDALDFLRKKASDLDVDSPTDQRGVNIDYNLLPKSEQTAPQGSVTPEDARITVTLTNIPLIEALRYVTNLAGVKFKVTDRGVSVVDLSVNTDVLITKEWRVSSDVIPIPEGTAIVREEAKNWLIANGVQFNGPAEAVYYAPIGRQKMTLGASGGGTSSVFLPGYGRLVVKNTEEQITLIDSILASNNSFAPAGESEGSQRISGLLPMKLDLPIMGRMIVFDGLAAAEHVEFRYEDWWTRARHLWLWFVAGGFACLILAQGRPWWRTCWVALGLTFFPLVVTVAATPVCNALLAGWLVSVVIQRVAVRMVFAPRRKAVTA